MAWLGDREMWLGLGISDKVWLGLGISDEVWLGLEIEKCGLAWG